MVKKKGKKNYFTLKKMKPSYLRSYMELGNFL